MKTKYLEMIALFVLCSFLCGCFNEQNQESEDSSILMQTNTTTHINQVDYSVNEFSITPYNLMKTYQYNCSDSWDGISNLIQGEYTGSALIEQSINGTIKQKELQTNLSLDIHSAPTTHLAGLALIENWTFSNIDTSSQDFVVQATFNNEANSNRNQEIGLPITIHTNQVCEFRNRIYWDYNVSYPLVDVLTDATQNPLLDNVEEKKLHVIEAYKLIGDDIHVDTIAVEKNTASNIEIRTQSIMTNNAPFKRNYEIDPDDLLLFKGVFSQARIKHGSNYTVSSSFESWVGFVIKNEAIIENNQVISKQRITTSNDRILVINTDGIESVATESTIIELDFDGKYPSTMENNIEYCVSINENLETNNQRSFPSTEDLITNSLNNTSENDLNILINPTLENYLKYGILKIIVSNEGVILDCYYIDLMVVDDNLVGVSNSLFKWQ
ncbi:hypothetical protein [Marinicellulosiphila megalodicopiae]|uniref:hypothetical protein n=1 Tax=Marinicellulosiphila megalodicopiae TaxID=2724896 RepID=UPI003BB16B4E